MLCCGDIELNPGPQMCYENFFKTSEKYKNNLRFVHLNFQDVSKKHKQLKSFINDMGKNAIIGISESWLAPKEKMSSWNLAPKTHKLFRCDRSSANCKKKGGGVMSFVPLRLAPIERDDLNLFDNSTFDTLWVECRCNFSRNCKSKTLLNITYNPLKKYQIDFLEQLMTNLDNASCESVEITLMGDYNLDYLTPLEKENLDTVVLHYGFTVASPYLPTRVCKSAKTHIDYILAENIDDEKSFVFETPFKTDHFCSVLFTEVSAGKQKCIRLPRFDKTKYVKAAFCQTLSDIPWCKIYQCSSANDMFNMFVYLLSSALEKHAPFKKNFLKKTPKLFKETWFDKECKNLQRERQLAFEKDSKNSSSGNWSAYSKLRSTLSSVVKEKQERFSWNCFISLKSSKDRWNFINNVRGQNQSVNIAAVKNSSWRLDCR